MTQSIETDESTGALRKIYCVDVSEIPHSLREKLEIDLTVTEITSFRCFSVQSRTYHVGDLYIVD